MSTRASKDDFTDMTLRMKHDRLFDDTSSRAAASTYYLQYRSRQLGRFRVRALLNPEGRYAYGYIVGV